MKYVITLNGKNYEVDVEKTDAVITSVTDAAPAQAAPVQTAPVQAAPAAPVQAAAPAAAVGAGTQVTSPMPGNILSVGVTVGQAVKAGQTMFVLEAMKMENDIPAPSDGVVKQILVQKGSTVDTDAVLAVI